MAKKKKEGAEAPDNGKQGKSRTAHGHEIVTGCEGDTWSVRVFFGKQLRTTIEGLPYEGDAYWAGDDWALANRVLIPQWKQAGKDFAPVVLEAGEEVVRLVARREPDEALAYAEQYIEAMHETDRAKVKEKQRLRAEYILKMREFDAIEEGLEAKIADLKDALKAAGEEREKYQAECRDPQVTMNFVFDRKRAQQGDIEDLSLNSDQDAPDLLAGLGAAKPKPKDGGEARP